jgi:hypothetical protein
MNIFKSKVRGEVKMHMGGCGSCKACFGDEDKDNKEKKKKEEKKKKKK